MIPCVTSSVPCVLKETIKIQLQPPNPRIRRKKSCSAEVRLESYFNPLEESVWWKKKNLSLPWVWGSVEVVLEGVEVGLG